MFRRKRKRSELWGGEFDPDAMAYFAAGSITDPTEKAAANAFIIGSKADGSWTTFSRVYLRSPTSLAAALLCCKTLTSQTAVNSPTHSSSGITFNGTTQYARSDVAPSATSQVISGSGHISVYINPGTGNGTVLAGCSSGLSKFWISGEAVA